MTSATCIVCNGAMQASRLPALLKCIHCGFISADLQLTSADLAKLYGERYFQGDEYADYVADRRVIEKSFQRRLETLLKFIPQPHSKHLYEVGCAHGFFLQVARPYFATTAGIDISQTAVEFAVSRFGLSVCQGDFLCCNPPSRIDVACLWDTIEHLAHPHLYIERLASRMPKGALLAITTGDIDSRIARWRGQRWRQIHPPTHLHYFSRSTLTLLLRRYGFAVRYCGYDGMYRSLDMMSYIIFAIKHKRPGIHAFLKRFGLLRASVYLNLHDIVFLIAERQNADKASDDER